MILVNGCKGIGTGLTDICSHNPLQIIEYFKKLENKNNQENKIIGIILRDLREQLKKLQMTNI